MQLCGTERGWAALHTTWEPERFQEGQSYTSAEVFSGLVLCRAGGFPRIGNFSKTLGNRFLGCFLAN